MGESAPLAYVKSAAVFNTLVQAGIMDTEYLVEMEAEAVVGNGNR